MTADATLRVEPFGDVVTVRPGESALDALLRQGRFVRHGCKHGGCGTCRAQLVSGACQLSDRTSFSLSDADRDAGIVLLCSTYVTTGEAVIDLTSVMELGEDEFRAGYRVAEHTARVTAVVPLTHELRAVRLRMPDDRPLAFVAGQYVEIEVPGDPGAWRSYSISSAPGDRHDLEILVKLIPGGRFSSVVSDRLAPGDRLHLRGPLGQLAIRLSHRRMVMIAGGSGIGPIRAMLLGLVQSGSRREVVVCHAAHSQRDLAYADELRALERQHDWLRYVPVLGAPEPGAAWDGELGHAPELGARRFSDLRGAEASLCGPPGLIAAVISALIAAGCKPRHIFFDRFVPTGGDAGVTAAGRPVRR